MIKLGPPDGKIWTLIDFTLLALAVTATMGDMITFVWANHMLPGFVELNPLVRKIQEEKGTAFLLGVRVVLMSTWIFVAGLYDKKGLERAARLVYLLAFVVGMIGTWSNLPK